MGEHLTNFYFFLKIKTPQAIVERVMQQPMRAQMHTIPHCISPSVGPNQDLVKKKSQAPMMEAGRATKIIGVIFTVSSDGHPRE
jgi:hypothetical protein